MTAVIEFMQQNFATMCLVAGLILGILFMKAVRIGLKLLEIGDRADGIFKMMDDIEQRWRSVNHELYKAAQSLEEIKRAQYYSDKVREFELELDKIKGKMK